MKPHGWMETNQENLKICYKEAEIRWLEHFGVSPFSSHSSHYTSFFTSRQVRDYSQKTDKLAGRISSETGFVTTLLLAGIGWSLNLQNSEPCFRGL